MIALAALLSGCASTEVQLLVGPRFDGRETELAAELTVTKRLSGRKVCSYTHTSEPHSGEPFNDNDELHTDFAGCGIRWGGQ